MQPCDRSSKLQAPDSLELLRSIPGDRTIGHETVNKRSNYVNEANYARKN